MNCYCLFLFFFSSLLVYIYQVRDLTVRGFKRICYSNVYVSIYYRAMKRNKLSEEIILKNQLI